VDPFRASVDATFNHHGIDAVMDPDGVALAVRLLPRRPDDIERFGSLRVQDMTGVYEIREGDFAGFGDGAVLLIGAERRRVQSHRVDDPRRYKVVLDTVVI
jgi:hypothetical protein